MKKLLFSFFCCLSVNLSTHAAITVLDYWRMGEIDSGAANGTTVTTLSNSVAGRGSLMAVGSPHYSSNVSTNAASSTGSRLCYSTTGTNIYAHGSISTNLTDNFGVECWVNPADTAAGTRCIVYNGNTSTSGWGLYQSGATFFVLYGGVAFSCSTPAHGRGVDASCFSPQQRGDASLHQRRGGVLHL